MRALHGTKSVGSFLPMESLYAALPPFTKLAEPSTDAHKIYTEMLAMYALLEKRVLSNV